MNMHCAGGNIMGNQTVQTEERVWSPEACKAAAEELRNAHPSDILAWAIQQFGPSDLTLACSFGYEDVALVDMLVKLNPEVDIFYLDTSLLFRETYETRDRLAEKYQKDFIRVATDLSLEQQAREWGDQLWARDPNQCCYLRKVAPLEKQLTSYRAWITGIRREQSPTRAHAEVVEWDHKFQLVKINPLAFWTSEQVWAYIKENEVPYNPLHDRQYPSIGCEPCTRPVKPGEDPRAGRWAGFTKTECGLHK
jgi:phosphoadenosine phosphosulfate reductase